MANLSDVTKSTVEAIKRYFTKESTGLPTTANDDPEYLNQLGQEVMVLESGVAVRRPPSIASVSDLSTHTREAYEKLGRLLRQVGRSSSRV